MSYQLLLDAVRYKLTFPDRVHIIMGNHDTAFINSSEVMKDGKEMNCAMHLALDSLLSGKNVLHICLGQPVKKVCLWYEEVLHRISDQYELNNTNIMWEMILPHRFIMTFNIEDFSVKRLEERLNDVTEQGIFFPQIVLLDGLPFNKTAQASLSKLKALAKEHGFPVWFTVMTHRENNIEQPDDIPSPISHMSDLFEVIVQLKPAGREINVQLIKGQKVDKVP
ncbi:hypothetical protein ES703_52617 [subsurface metagenome]